MTRRWLWIAAFGLSLGRVGLPVSGQQATFSSGRETVRVDVLVTDRGRPVRGLGPGDFEILDSGVRQEVDFVSFEQLPISLVLALDGSRSISPGQLATLREAGRAVLGQLQPADRAGLLTFTDAVTLRQDPTGDAARVLAALDGMAASTRDDSGTALVDTCFTAMTILDDAPGRALAIVFTDGVDTSSWLAPEQVLDAARRSNVVFYAVSTGRLPRGAFLRDLTEATGGSTLDGQSAATAGAAFVRILEEFRQRYLIGFSPVNVPPAGWHPITVRVKGRGLEVRARAGYQRAEGK